MITDQKDCFEVIFLVADGSNQGYVYKLHIQGQAGMNEEESRNKTHW